LGFNKKIKFISEYFGIGLPFWMESRKTLFIFSFLDFLFIYLFFRYFTFNYFETINNGRFICFAIIFSLTSYLSGRYSFLSLYESNSNKLFVLLIKTLIVTISSFVIDKILIIYFQNWIPIDRNKGIIIFFISYFIQSFKFFLNIVFIKNKYFYLIGNKSQKEIFTKDILSISRFSKFIFKDFSEQKTDLYKFKTFIILGENFQNFYENYSYLINDRSEIMTASKWCEKYLQRIPTKYLTKNDFNFNSLFNPSQSLNWRLKRFGDIVISISLIFVSSPILILAAFLIKLEDKGPIFYTQERTGLYGKRFKITKLRSMKKDSEKDGPVWAILKDPRITKVGRILRKSRIDELPQLWSVIKGDMSLIGPRPERPEIEKLLVNEIPFYNFRNTVRPGLSGWAQVNYSYGASIEDSKNKFSYDVFYLRNYSLLLDLLILLKTLKLIINMEGSDPK